MTTVDRNAEQLVDLHAAHHARLDDLLLQTVELLMDVDVDGAGGPFAEFVVELRAGLALEEAVILPAYRRLPTHAPQGRPEVVDGDHVILERGIEAATVWLRALSSLEAPHRRREIAIGLPVVHRLRGTLEHHGEREFRHVYPTVAPLLDEETLRRAIGVLRRLVPG